MGPPGGRGGVCGSVISQPGSGGLEGLGVSLWVQECACESTRDREV